MLTIPDDLLRTLLHSVAFSRSTPSENLSSWGAISRVCKLWHEICSESTFYSELADNQLALCQDTVLNDVWKSDFKTRQIKKCHNLDHFQTWLSTIPPVHKVSIQQLALGNKGFSQQEKMRITRLLTLKILNLDCPDPLPHNQMSASEILEIVQNCPALEEFHCSKSNLTDEHISQIVESCPKIHTLVLNQNKDLSQKIFNALLPLAPVLRTLVLKSCQNVTFKELSKFLSQTRTLQVLDLSYCKGLREDDLAPIFELSNLEVLRICGLGALIRIPHTILAISQKLPLLKKLKLDPRSSKFEQELVKLKVSHPKLSLCFEW